VLAHWDEVETRARSAGHLGGTWSNLGRAAGTVAAGVTRIQLPPGMWSTPAHIHGPNEEIFYVLAGSGLSWQDGETYDLRAGDCLVHRVARRAHTLLAGDDGAGTLELLPSPQAVVYSAGEETHPIQRGHVVARPAGTGVAHAFRGGDEGLTFLAYGPRKPDDVAYYPRSNKLFWRGLGVIGRIESLEYDDGEL
jgi:uncharacterized cupin superfamily protein